MYEAIDQSGGFEWGTNDCLMFSLRIAQVITGIDYGKKYAGYKTSKGAARRLLKYGGVEGMATDSFGEPKSPLMAKRGDIVSWQNMEDIALGICVGDKIAVVADHGIDLIPMTEAINAWSV